MPLLMEQGKELVGLSRTTLDAFVEHGSFRPARRADGFMAEKRGAFVTLNLWEGDEETMRGCIGFPAPVKALGDAVQEATVAAASEDPRFPPVSTRELPKIRIEVSALTSPELISGRGSPVEESVRVGVDGLIVSDSERGGLLLPQIAVEYSLGREEFLAMTCEKAGLPPDAWRDARVQVHRFQAEIFGEKSPRGEVARVQL